MDGDGLSTSKNKFKGLGEVTVKIYRIRILRDTEEKVVEELVPLPNVPVPEKALKDRALSNRAGLVYIDFALRDHSRY